VILISIGDAAEIGLAGGDVAIEKADRGEADDCCDCDACATQQRPTMASVAKMMIRFIAFRSNGRFRVYYLHVGKPDDCGGSKVCTGHPLVVPSTHIVPFACGESV
jgi:hypothetical protein